MVAWLINNKTYQYNIKNCNYKQIESLKFKKKDYKRILYKFKQN